MLVIESVKAALLHLECYTFLEVGLSNIWEHFDLKLGRLGFFGQSFTAKLLVKDVPVILAISGNLRGMKDSIPTYDNGVVRITLPEHGDRKETEVQIVWTLEESVFAIKVHRVLV